jgi:hypothetical protein
LHGDLHSTLFTASLILKCQGITRDKQNQLSSFFQSCSVFPHYAGAYSTLHKFFILNVLSECENATSLEKYYKKEFLQVTNGQRIRSFMKFLVINSAHFPYFAENE